MNTIKEIICTEIKLLGFRKIKPDFKNFGNHYLALGIISAWLAGVGRYWDNPRADLWQYLGLGSVAYIFILAFILWLIVMPLKPANWSYKAVLTFVGMTSPPGILYAIPVERFMTLQGAQEANVFFLAVVAIWRIALLFQFLKTAAKLRGFSIIVALLLPLVLIVTSLTALNLEHVVFKLMAGLEEHEHSQNDLAYSILLLITTFSVMATPVFLILYTGMVYNIRKRSKAQ
jgi:hypothetical protein